jgi:hypothetical protein
LSLPCGKVAWLAINLDQAVIHIIINTIIIGPVLWLAGRALVGKQKAKFTDGLWIAALGTVIGEILSYFFVPGIIVSIVMVIIWLGLIKHFFDCGWLKALLIAIVAIIIFIIIAAVLLILGFAVFRQFIPTFF